MSLLVWSQCGTWKKRCRKVLVPLLSGGLLNVEHTVLAACSHLPASAVQEQAWTDLDAP